MNGFVIKEMDLAYKLGPVVPNMRVYGKITKPVVSASSLIMTVISMKVTGTTTKQTAMESINILMERNTGVFGLTICSMVLVLKQELMALNSLENTNSETSKALDYMSNKMVQTFSANGKIINSRASASTSGTMDARFKESGRKVK